ncbi:hypothetical protein ACGFNX_27005 [Streptomyces sp. NPDC048723]|uniref:hypothetical protein n=1 Tax=Streptomyces sp. NPDC048723 TaxID=3365589 RepID=UPI00370FDE0D
MVWWRAGEEVVRDRTAADLAARFSDVPGKEQRTVLRIIAAGAGRWSCWPGVARASVRLVVPVSVVAAWSGWWSVAAAGTGVLSAAGVTSLPSCSPSPSSSCARSSRRPQPAFSPTSTAPPCPVP